MWPPPQLSPGSVSFSTELNSHKTRKIHFLKSKTAQLSRSVVYSTVIISIEPYKTGLELIASVCPPSNSCEQTQDRGDNHWISRTYELNNFLTILFDKGLIVCFSSAIGKKRRSWCDYINLFQFKSISLKLTLHHWICSTWYLSKHNIFCKIVLINLNINNR